MLNSLSRQENALSMWLCSARAVQMPADEEMQAMAAEAAAEDAETAADNQAAAIEEASAAEMVDAE
jgi:hypothetical protein